MSRAALYSLFAIFVCLAAPACSGEEETPTGPTTPTPTTVTDRFEGTIGPNHARVHAFSSGSGTIVATLISVAPDSATALSVGLGIWNGAACSLQITNDAIQQAQTVIGQASSAGTFCVRVSDNGAVTQPTTYVVEVVHNE